MLAQVHVLLGMQIPSALPFLMPMMLTKSPAVEVPGFPSAPCTHSMAHDSCKKQFLAQSGEAVSVEASRLYEMLAVTLQGERSGCPAASP